MADKKILVVDDDPNIRKLVREFLSFYGYHVDCASDGLEALRFIKNGCYNLVITDYNMPELNGVEFTKIIREKKDYPPIIATSSYDMKAVFIEAGADLFIPKPVDLKVLRKEIELLTVLK